MIGKLIGVLDSVSQSQLLLNVQGVCYEVDVSAQTLAILPEVAEPLTLHIHPIIREDQHSLVGFATEVERSLFRHLIKVNGVGARLALAILSSIEVPQLISAIVQSDVATLVQVPGIGKRTAERLLVELRDKIDEGTAGFDAAVASPQSGHAHTEQAVSALISLGYKPQEAKRMIERVGDATDLSTEQLIKMALQGAVS